MKTKAFLFFAVCGIITTNHSIAQQSKYSWDNLPVIKKPEFKNDTFNIVNYGAQPDGITLNTASINKAITACSEKGGGVVLVPAGMWKTGPIVLKSNVNLHVSRSAWLQFTDDKSQYHLIEGNFEGHQTIRNESPISGTGLENVAITGNGIIDGHGEAWRAMGKDRVTENEWKKLITTGVVSSDGKTWYPSKSYAKGAKNAASGNDTKGKTMKDYMFMKDYLRPNLMVLTGCKRILLEDVTFENSPAWCLHTLQCEHLTFDGVKIRNKENAQNGDGMDIESCAYVKVENCTLNCGDDGICIKSGKDEEGRKRGQPSRYIVIRNNVVYKAHGGFVIGSEMSGGAHDIFVSDCNFIGTANGLRFKTVRGRGGVVENIFIRNINMRDIIGDAITFDMYYFTKMPALGQNGEKAPIPVANITTPQFRNFYIKNVICDGAARGILFRGLPEMNINNIYVDNATIIAKEGMEIAEANNISLKNIVFHCPADRPLIHIENSSNINFDNINSNLLPKTLFSLDGDRTNAIHLTHSPRLENSSSSQFNYGAKKSALTTL